MAKKTRSKGKKKAKNNNKVLYGLLALLLGGAYVVTRKKDETFGGSGDPNPENKDGSIAPGVASNYINTSVEVLNRSEEQLKESLKDTGNAYLNLPSPDAPTEEWKEYGEEIVKAEHNLDIAESRTNAAVCTLVGEFNRIKRALEANKVTSGESQQEEERLWAELTAVEVRLKEMGYEYGSDGYFRQKAGVYDQVLADSVLSNFLASYGYNLDRTTGEVWPIGTERAAAPVATAPAPAVKSDPTTEDVADVLLDIYEAELAPLHAKVQNGTATLAEAKELRRMTLEPWEIGGIGYSMRNLPALKNVYVEATDYIARLEEEAASAPSAGDIKLQELKEHYSAVDHDAWNEYQWKNYYQAASALSADGVEGAASFASAVKHRAFVMGFTL
jgi:hypothetical protein